MLSTYPYTNKLIEITNFQSLPNVEQAYIPSSNREKKLREKQFAEAKAILLQMQLKEIEWIKAVDIIRLECKLSYLEAVSVVSEMMRDGFMNLREGSALLKFWLVKEQEERQESDFYEYQRRLQESFFTDEARHILFLEEKAILEGRKVDDVLKVERRGRKKPSFKTLEEGNR